MPSAGRRGRPLEETGAASQGMAQRAKRDIAKVGDIALLLAGAQTPIARLERAPSGEIYKQPIGDLPKSADFVDAAKSIAGDEAPPALTDKLATLYNDHGILPAEAAHDAVKDPTVKQSLLSSAPDDLPARYVQPAEQPTKPLDFSEAKRAVASEQKGDVISGDAGGILDKISVGAPRPEGGLVVGQVLPPRRSTTCIRSRRWTRAPMSSPG
jgi:hypothetical protein